MAQANAPVPPVPARKRTRSPAYPFMNLESAIARAKQFYDKEQRNAANVNIATTHWSYAEGSSYGVQTVASLIYFGLMQDEGTGEKRTVRLTQAALRILLDTRPDSAERAELIKLAALAPKIHRQLWEKWGANLPSDPSLRHTLLFDWETPFNENAVDGFIAEYKSTIAFAKLVESDTVGLEVKDNDPEEGNKTPYTFKVGDYVQWEHNGVLGLPEPKRIREITPDGKRAYVEGQYGAVSIDELILERTPLVPPNPPDLATKPGIQGPPKTYMQEYVVPLSDGSKAVFQWPSSLTKEDVDDLKDSLKIVERKISRSATPSQNETTRFHPLVTTNEGVS